MIQLAANLSDPLRELLRGDESLADAVEVGAEVRFDVGYSALLRAMMSPYVEKVYLPRSPNKTEVLSC